MRKDIEMGSGYQRLSRRSALTAIVAVLALMPAALAPAASTAELVAALSWQSVGGECSGLVWHVYPTGKAAKRLLRVGKSATTDLANALADPERAVAAHLILCRVWSRDAECATRLSSSVASGAPIDVVGRQLDVNSITETGGDELVAEYQSGELVWRTYGGGRSVVSPSSLESNRAWWCDYFSGRGLRITSACSGRTRVSRPVQRAQGPRHAARR